MRATSSGMGYCILCAIRLPLEIKELAELLGGKAGRNSLTPEKIAQWNFHEASKSTVASNSKFAKALCLNLLRGCNRLRALF